MFTAQFSEFSYGFAITDNFIHSGIPHTGQTPTFPSLIAEGKSGGYDVKIPLRPVALFLQFKIPQVVRRRGKNMPSGFWTPYLRMHLRTKRPNQHDLLLQWEGRGNLVYYATPDFWRTRDLDRHFSSRSVHAESWYIRSSQIGPLDDKAHHLAYEERNKTFWLCSDPVQLEADFGSELFAKEIHYAVERAPIQEPLSFLRHLASDIAEFTHSRVPQLPDVEQGPIEAAIDERKLSPEERERRRRRAEDRLIVHAAREVAYMAQVRLGCTLAITGAD